VRRIQLEEALGSPEEMSRLRADFVRGGVAAIPTDTFYALACDPASERGVERIFELKARGAVEPLLVLFSERTQLERLGVDASAEALDRFFRLWPAPLTVVFPIRAPLPASRGGATLAVRMPAAAGLRALLSQVGPLTGTSATRSGDAPLEEPGDVVRELGAGIDVLVDGGRAPGGKPSTIIDATVLPPRVLRAGAFAWPDGPQLESRQNQ
jgi:L-threonylcarbamoyladenylate synthase